MKRKRQAWKRDHKGRWQWRKCAGAGPFTTKKNGRKAPR